MKIVWISLDSVRADFFGPKSKVKETEHIDRICQEGIYFPKTVVQAPFTAPSHGAMLTGLLPYENGLRNFEGELRDGTRSVFDYLSDEGFETVAFLGSGMLKNRGFDNWNLKGFEHLNSVKNELEGDDDRFVFVHYWNTHTPYKSRMPNNSVKNILANYYLKASEMLGLKRGYMGQNESSIRNIWRLGYKYFWSHRMDELRNLMKENEEATKSRMKEGYIKSIKEADSYIGDIIEKLESEDEEFLLIVTSDHGESFNEHNERDEFEEFEHGYFLYENAIKVPAVIYGSNIDPRKEDGTVRSIDLLPTVLDLIGAEKQDLDGKSLLEKADNRIAYSETHRPPECDKKSVQNNLKKLVKNNNEKRFFELPKESKGDKSKELEEEMKKHVKREKENNKASEEEKIKEQLESLGYR